MRKPAVFLDRDGTIIEDRGHLRDAGDVVFYPFTFEALQRLQAHFELFIVTNQSGIAKSIIGAADAKRVNQHIVDRLQEENIQVRAVYVCPHQREDMCACIKPSPHFPRQAAVAYGIDLSRSVAIGDHPHDADMGVAMGGTGIYVLTGHGPNHRDDLPAGTRIAANLMAAADWLSDQLVTGEKQGK